MVPVSPEQILNFQKISSLAENTSSKVVFNEVLATAGRDIVTKDISRIRGGWSMQDAFYVSAILFKARIFLLEVIIYLILNYFYYFVMCYHPKNL